jgi:manganese-dependent ADP-ribose/CDP-alcohol diphosphatase
VCLLWWCAGRFLFLNLDTYDISLVGNPEGSEGRELALAYLSKNPNEDKNSPLNLEGAEQRFVKYNGGVGAAQLEWLRATLDEAARCVA